MLRLVSGKERRARRKPTGLSLQVGGWASAKTLFLQLWEILRCLCICRTNPYVMHRVHDEEKYSTDVIRNVFQLLLKVTLKLLSPKGLPPTRTLQESNKRLIGYQTRSYFFSTATEQQYITLKILNRAARTKCF